MYGLITSKGGGPNAALGNKRQNDQADNGKLQGRFNVGKFDPPREAMQIILEGKEEQANHRYDGSDVNIAPSTQSTHYESKQRGDFSRDPQLAPRRGHSVGNNHQRADCNEGHEHEPSLIQLALQESANGTQERNESKSTNPAEQQLSVAFSLALETEQQAETESGAETECQIEIEHPMTTYSIIDEIIRIQHWAP